MSSADDRSSNFIRSMVREHLEAGVYDQVVTRFPPEPNGYLHIGHTKAICVNFGLAEEFGGRCHLRFDDTNPTKEDPEFVASIQNDIRWLGFDWGDHLYFASEYFPQLYAWAQELIEKGLAYVCEQNEEEMRAARGTVTEAGTPSPWRDRPAAESLELFARMKAGDFEEGTCTLRAKMDMSHANMKMRDPVIWRILRVAHHHVGDGWNCYPMYDFAHGLSDAIEHVTHSLCTLEFENNRAVYDWYVAQCATPATPRQYEFARLEIGYTVMSKRKLIRLVKDKLVIGWDDPRMPTLAGMRRRGYRPEAIRAFIASVGVAKANSLVDYALLEHAVRDDLNHEAKRVMAVVDPLEVEVTTWTTGTEWLTADYWPHDVPKEGTREVPFTRTLFIERADFAKEPPRKWRRLAPGREVRLRYGYWIRCDEVVEDADGRVVKLRCSHDPTTRGGKNPADGRKPSGTIHWVSATEGLPCELRRFDRLFDHEVPDAAEGDLTDHLNPHSKTVHAGFVEPSVASDPVDTRYQFERLGYFWRDPEDGRGEALVFNRIVSLKDGWKKAKAAPTPSPAKEVPVQPTVRRDFEATTPEEAERYARFQFLGLSKADAGTLAGDAALATLFEAALAAGGSAETSGKLVVNNVAAARKEGALPFGGAAIGKLAVLLDEGLSSKLGKKVLAEMLAGGGDPAQIVEAKGWRTITDESQLGAWIDAVLADNPDKVAAYQGGRTGLLGFFVGQVMGRSRGQADPKAVNRMLREALG